MEKTYKGLALLLLSFLLFSVSHVANAMEKGIYISQTTLEDTKYFNYLISRAKKAGITTFVVDLERPSKLTEKNLALLKENHINYVARVMIFPNGGGKAEEVTSTAHWEKKYKLINYALNYGAEQIQLDYIRYNTKQGASPEHAKNILKVVQFYKDRLAKQKIPMQMDVFGIASFGEESNIGQNIKLFADSIDVLCPMVYPSHFEPYREHAVTPYKTVYSSLEAIKSQFGKNKPPFKLFPYIELSNYRYPLSQEKKLSYIYAQIQAAEASGVEGWYAWSANNYYDNLFKVLETRQVK